MLLKQSQSEKRTKPNASSKQQRASGAMKLTAGPPLPRVSRKVMKGIATKRTAHGQQRLIAARTEERTTVDPCDNSNDSGLGFDHHLEFQLAARSTVRFADQEAAWANEHSEVKRKKLEIKLESDDANDDFGFPETMSRRREESQRITTRTGAHLEHTATAGIAMVRTSQSRPQAIASRRTAAVPVTSQSAGAITSRNGKTQLQIVCQPETQHRARYQTEGSRGAVKDRSGNGFPVVKLTNYNKPATLEVFIGTDVGRVQPHMFYQACRVSGKNSTPCVEKKIDGTVVIEVDFDPAKDYVITCDCVGILKERNVDVEHRFPNEQQTRNKKKSTRCRMVFRTKILLSDGTEEWLQITSHPIVCTQPPGVPEICKKSLSASPCTGGLELFILGKNFLKDTRVLFQQTDAETPWEESVQPDKEFLQQTHLVCVVPPYRRTDITESVTVKLAITSSGKTSEPHNFTYTPTIQQSAVVPEGTQPCVTLVQSAVSHSGDIPHGFPRSSLMTPGATVMLAEAASSRTSKTSPNKKQYLPLDSAPSSNVGDPDSQRIMMWQNSMLPAAKTPKIEGKISVEQKEMDQVMSGKIMPPPPLLPLVRRRPSSHVHLILPDSDPGSLKTELTEDDNSRSPEDIKVVDLRLKPVATVNPLGLASDLTNTHTPTMATLDRFVTGHSGTPLPTQSGPSVEKYLSNIEHPSESGGITKPTANCVVPPCKIAGTVAQPLLHQQTPNVSVPLMYNTQNTSECKPQFSSEDASLLQEVRHNALNINADSETVIGRRHMMVLQESQSRNPLVSSMDETVSSMIDSVTNNSSLMMFPGRERTIAREEKTQHLSALVSHMQQTESEKLDAIVNSAAVSHMVPTPSSTDQTSPIPVKKMSLDPPTFNLIPTCTQMLSSSNTQLNIDAGTAASNSPSVMFSNHERTSPIAVKTIITSSPEGGRIILTSTSQNSSGAANMMDTLQTHGQVLTSGSTSPIAVKKMIETHCESQMLSPNSNNTNPGQMLNRTSPIAIKSMMEQASASVNPDSCLTNTPPIAIKTILNSEVGETLMPATTIAAVTQGTSSENMALNSLMQQENVTSAGNSALNVLVQTALSNQQSTQAASASSANALVQSALNNQSPVILTSSAHVSAESARLNALAQNALNSQNQSSILVSEETSRLNSLTQSILNDQTQQQTVMVSEENSFTQPLISSQNQQSVVMGSNTQVSENSASLATLTQSLMSGTSQSSTPQMSEDTRLNQLTSMLTNQAQQQASEDSTRMNTLTQNILNPQTQQQTLVAAEDSARLDSLTQSIQQAAENNPVLNSLTQTGTVLVSSAAMCEQSAKLRSYTQSLLSNQNQQALMTESTTLNALHTHQEATAQSCIPAIVTQASQNEALLNSIFVSNQNPPVQTPTTVIVGSGNLLEGAQFNTPTTESQPTTRESSSGFMAQMFLHLTEDKMKKDAEISIANNNKGVGSSSVQQKQEKVLQPEGAAVVQQTQQPTQQKKSEEGMVPQELAQMSENDLLSYINPSTFDQGF